MKSQLPQQNLRLGFLMLALCVACASLPAQNPPRNQREPMDTGPFKIAGVVVSATTGEPLARTRITITNTSKPRQFEWGITAESGRFEFNNLAAGKYSLQGARRGYIPGAYNQHEQFSTAIVTGATFDTENLVLRLMPSAMISGKVLDESGEPIRNATVRLFRENHFQGVSQIGMRANSSTDDRGYFDFWPVAPGTFYIAVDARPWYALHPTPPQQRGTQVLPSAVNAALDVAYPTIFYGDTTEADSATPIAIKGGDHAEVEIHMDPVPALHLLFHAQENGQGGFTSPMLEKQVFGSREYVPAEGIQNVSGDTYEVVGVPAGHYTVKFQGSQQGNTDQVSEVNLSKDGQTLDPSQAETLSNADVTVKIPGEEKLPQQLFISLRDSRTEGFGSQSSDSDGVFHFQGLRAGKYLIVAGSPNMPYWVVKISSQGTDTAGNSFELAPGATASITATLVGGAARVEGVVNRAGKPAAGVMVVLVPEKPESNLDLFRRDQSDQDGSFIMRGVAPGAYTVIAIDDGWSLDWSRPAVLARYTPLGQKLTVPSASKGVVSLPAPVEVQPRW